MSSCDDLSVTSSHVVVGDIVARAQRKTPARVQQSCMLSLVKYYLKHLEDKSKYLAEELIDFHCHMVNPKDLVVSSNFFHTLAVEPGFQNYPLVRHYLTLTQYTKELLQGLQPMPPISTIVIHCDGLRCTVTPLLHVLAL